MISPVTCVTMVMFAGSGLYLYQAKHHAEVETHQIRQLIAEADAIRQHTGVLITDYQLENDPERLGELAARFLPLLKPTQPTQFTTVADIDQRLPAVGLPPPKATAIDTGLVFDYPPATAAASVPVAQIGDEASHGSPSAKPVELAAKSRPVARPIAVLAAREPAPRDRVAGPGFATSYSQFASSGGAVSSAPVSGPPVSSPLISSAQAAAVLRPNRPQYSPVVATAPMYPFGAQYASPFGAAAPSSGSALGMARGMTQHPYVQTVTPPLAPGGSGG